MTTQVQGVGYACTYFMTRLSTKLQSPAFSLSTSDMRTMPARPVKPKRVVEHFQSVCAQSVRVNSNIGLDAHSSMQQCTRSSYVLLSPRLKRWRGYLVAAYSSRTAARSLLAWQVIQRCWKAVQLSLGQQRQLVVENDRFPYELVSKPLHFGTENTDHDVLLELLQRGRENGGGLFIILLSAPPKRV